MSGDDGWFTDALPPPRGDVSGVDGQWRLKLTGFVDERPLGNVYTLDTNRYENAAFHFLLEPDQRLPRIPPGGVVEARGRVAVGARPTFVADGVEIRPASDLKPGGDSLIEGGQTIAHPAVVGAHPNWRYTQNHSFDSVEAWDHFLRRRLRIALITIGIAVAWLLLCITFIVWAIVSDRSGGGGGGGGGAGAGLGAMSVIASLLLARHARQALRYAQRLRDSPAEAMYMNLWWSAGHGHGPIAIASLGPTEADFDQIRVPVIGVGEDLIDQNEVVPVSVHGRWTAAPLIEHRGQLLWPAERARYRTSNGWEPIKRRRRLTSTKVRA